VCLPLLIFPCTIKSRSSLLAPAHPVDPGKMVVCVCSIFFFFLSSPNLSRRRLDVCHTSTWCGLSANLRCRSEMRDTQLVENSRQKNRHLRTIAQLCRGVSSQIRHYQQSEKKLVKQQYVLHMSLQYGERLPTGS